MKNKRIFVVLLILSLAVALVWAAGCAPDEPAEVDDPDEVADPNDEPEELDVDSIVKASGPIGSGWYPVSITLGEIWMDEIDGLVVTTIEGGGFANVELIHEGEDAHVAFCHTNAFMDAKRGAETFDGRVLDDVKLIAGLYPSWTNIAVMADSDIYEIEDILDKDISPGMPGFSSDYATQVLLDMYGSSYEDVEAAGGNISYAGYADAATMLRDGTIDVAIGLGSPEVTAFQEVDAMRPIRLIEIPDDVLQEILDLGWGYSIEPDIPANTYREQTEPVSTYNVFSAIIGNANLPEEFVYQLTKNIWENLDRAMEEHPVRAAWWEIEQGPAGIDPEHIHPGALRYYQEVGVMD